MFKECIQSVSIVSLSVVTVLTGSVVSAEDTKKPNVILVITDDQGYCDFGFTGNKAINTPTLDKLREESILLDLSLIHI